MFDAVLAFSSVAALLDTQEAISLEARINALEARNRDLQAQVDVLMAERSQASPPQPPAQLVAPIAPVIAADPWDVSYAGVQVGIVDALNQEAYLSDFYRYSAPETSAYVVGGQFGRRWQSGLWVIGAKVEATLPTGPSASELYDVQPPYSSDDVRYRYRRSFTAAASGELGFVVDDSLYFASIGLEIARLDVRIEQLVTAKSTENEAAPFVGLGVASRVGDNWSLEAEARYGYGRQGLMQNNISLGLHLNYLIY